MALSTFTKPCNVCKHSIPNHSPALRCLCSKAPVPRPRLWHTSSSVLHHEKTHPIISLTASIRRMTSTYCRNAFSLSSQYPLTLAGNKSNTLATHSPSLSPPPLFTSTTRLLISPATLKLSVANTRCSRLVYYPGSAIHLFLNFTSRNVAIYLPSVYPDVPNVRRTLLSEKFNLPSSDISCTIVTKIFIVCSRNI